MQVGDNTRSRSHKKRQRSHSPHQYEDWNFERSRQPSDHQRSKSHVKYTTKKLSPVRHRSRSTRRRSRRPKVSTKSKSFLSKRKSTSPKTHNFYSSYADNDFSHFFQKNSSCHLLSQSDCQAELGCITEEIEKNDLYKKALREEENRRRELQQQHVSSKRKPQYPESGLKPHAINSTVMKDLLSDGRFLEVFLKHLKLDREFKFYEKILEENVLRDIATSNPAASVSTEPEKVPYLCEPPDESHEEEVYAKDTKLQTQFSFPYNKNAANNFPPNKISRRNFDPLYPQTDSFHPAYTDISGLDVYDTKAKHISSIMHNPASYNAGFMPMDYHPTKKYEDNIRSSRLSPETEAALLNFIKRDRKHFSSKNKRFRSLERRNHKHSVHGVSKFEPR